MAALRRAYENGWPSRSLRRAESTFLGGSFGSPSIVTAERIVRALAPGCPGPGSLAGLKRIGME